MISKIHRAGIIAGLCITLAVASSGEAKAAEPYDAFTKTQEWEVLKETNKNRYKGGKEGLSIFASLQKAAHTRAKEITTSFSHTRPDGTSCFTVLQDMNISYRFAGENIAAGQGTPQSVVECWMDSTGHRANIMSEYYEYDHLGAGYAYNGGSAFKQYWVQLFTGGCTTTEIAMDTTALQTYQTGTTIAGMNRYLVITCDKHGVSYMPVTDEMCTGYNKNQAGEQTITVTYHNLQTTFPVQLQDGSKPKEEVKKPGKVIGLSVKKTTSTKARISWKEISADGYEIYMKTGNGKYKKLKTIQNAKTTTYTVKKLKKGKKYTFKVRAYRLDGKKKIYGKFSISKAV